MAEQVEEIRANSAMITLNATTTDSSANFQQHVRSLTIRSDDDVWINFDAAATTSVPSIFLKNGEVLNITDVNYRTIHVIVNSDIVDLPTMVRVTYQYI